MKNIHSLVEDVHTRFYNFLINYQLARYGDDEGKEINDNFSVYNTDKKLLVEKISHRERKRKEEKKQNYINQVAEELFSKVEKEIIKKLDKPKELIQEISPIPEVVVSLIEDSNVKASSINKINNLLTNYSIIHRDLVSLMNNGAFQKKMGIQTNKKINNYKLAVSYMGLDNAKNVIPTLIAKKYFLFENSYFPLTPKKLWLHNILTANVAKILAEDNNEKHPEFFYLSGLFHDIGLMFLFRLYDDIHYSTWVNEVKESRENQEYDKNRALGEIQPSKIHLRNLFLKYGEKVTKIIFESLNFNRIPLPEVYESWAEDSFKEQTNYAKILTKANAYSEFLLLYKNKLISLEDGKKFLQSNHFTNQEISKIQKVNINYLQQVHL
tara:strand:+ start:33069 stop:34214 length:1146 start_codon:yes stop_codon:yes gene_type:complete